jgi:hypothetical protein
MLRIVWNPCGVVALDVGRYVLLYKLHVVSSKAKDNLSLSNDKIYLHTFPFSALQRSGRNEISKVVISVFNGGRKKTEFSQSTLF